MRGHRLRQGAQPAQRLVVLQLLADGPGAHGDAVDGVADVVEYRVQHLRAALRERLQQRFLRAHPSGHVAKHDDASSRFLGSSLLEGSSQRAAVDADIHAVRDVLVAHEQRHVVRRLPADGSHQRELIHRHRRGAVLEIAAVRERPLLHRRRARYPAEDGFSAGIEHEPAGPVGHDHAVADTVEDRLHVAPLRLQLAGRPPQLALRPEPRGHVAHHDHSAEVVARAVDQRSSADPDANTVRPMLVAHEEIDVVRCLVVAQRASKRQLFGRHQRDAVRIVQPVSLGAFLDRRVRQIRADDALRAAIEDQVIAIGVAGDHAVVDVGEDRVHEARGAAQLRDRRPQPGLRSADPGDVTDHGHAAADARLAFQRAHSDGRDDPVGVVPIAHHHLDAFRLRATHGAHQGHLVRLQPGYAVGVEQAVCLGPLRLRRGRRAEYPFRTRVGQQDVAGGIGRHYPVFDAVERGGHQVVAPLQPGDAALQPAIAPVHRARGGDLQSKLARRERLHQVAGRVAHRGPLQHAVRRVPHQVEHRHPALAHQVLGRLAGGVVAAQIDQRQLRHQLRGLRHGLPA